MIVRPARRIDNAISFGVFCRLAPSTRAIILSRNVSPGRAVMRTTIRSESTLVPPVTAERSPPDSRMTGADSPVMADSSTDAMPSIDITVGRDHLARVHDALVSDVEKARRHLLDAAIGEAPVGDRLAAGLAQRRGLGLAAALGHRLGEVREQHRGPQEQRHQEGEDVLARRRLPEVTDEEDRRVHAADLDHEHHRVAEHHPRIELAEAVSDRGPDDRSVEDAAPPSRGGRLGGGAVTGPGA